MSSVSESDFELCGDSDAGNHPTGATVVTTDAGADEEEDGPNADEAEATTVVQSPDQKFATGFPATTIPASTGFPATTIFATAGSFPTALEARALSEAALDAILVDEVLPLIGMAMQRGRKQIKLNRFGLGERLSNSWWDCRERMVKKGYKVTDFNGNSQVVLVNWE